MSFFCLCVAILVIFIQPDAIFPVLLPYQLEKIAIIIALVCYIFSPKKAVRGFWANKTNIFFILFAFMQVLSSFRIWSMAGLETFNLWLRIGIVYFLIVRSATDLNGIKHIILMVIISISYLVWYFYSNLLTGYEAGKIMHAYGWFENANDFVLITVTVIPLILLFVNISRSFFRKILFILLAIAFSVSVLFTSSRGGILSLLCIGLLSLLYLQKVPRFLRVVIFGILIAGTLTMGLTNIESRKDLLPGQLYGDPSSENRLEQWKAGLRMMKAQPLFGVGRGEFIYAVQDYGGIKGLAPHNTLIQVFSESGIPAGIFFFLFSFYTLLDSRKLLSRVKHSKTEVKSFIQFVSIALFGFWICAFFGNRYNEYILYILVALLVAIKENIVYGSGDYENVKF